MRDTVDVAKDVAWWLEVETSFFLLEDGAHRLAQLYNIIGEGSTVQVARHFFGARGRPARHGLRRGQGMSHNSCLTGAPLVPRLILRPCFATIEDFALPSVPTMCM